MYALPSPHHAPSNLRLRVTSGSCVRVEAVVASGSGTSTQPTPSVVPGTL